MKLGMVRVIAAAIALVHAGGHAESLPELIDGVLASHPSLRAQRAQVESARQAVEGARWQYFPTPSIGVEQVDANHTDPSYPSFGDKNVTTLRLQQPLWSGGRLGAGLDKAEAGVLANQAAMEGVRQELSLRVVQIYSDWLGAQQKRLAFQKSLQAHQTLQQQIVRRIAGGASPRSDLTLLLGRAQQTEADLASAQAQEQAALGRLSQLRGQPVRAEALAASPRVAQPLPADTQELLEQALLQSPNVVKLQAQARMAEAEISERRADMLPEAYLRAERQYGNYSFPNIAPLNRYFVGLSSHFGAGLSSLTQVSAAQARHAAAEADVDSARITLGEQIQADHAQVRAGQTRLAALLASLQASADMVQAWNRQFIAGRKSWLDVMNAVRELAQLEAQVADARASQLLLSWRLAITGLGLDGALNQSLEQADALQLPDSDGQFAADMPADIPLYPVDESSALELRMVPQINALGIGQGLGAAAPTAPTMQAHNNEVSW